MMNSTHSTEKNLRRARNAVVAMLVAAFAALFLVTNNSAHAQTTTPTPEERLRSECNIANEWEADNTATSGHVYCYFQLGDVGTELRDVAGDATYEACYLTQAGADADEAGVGGPVCSDVFPGEGATLDLPATAVSEIEYNCGAGAEVTGSEYQCQCISGYSGTPPNCVPTVVPTTRAVTIDPTTDGSVVLTVNGAEVSGADLAAVTVGATLVFSAIPADDEHYVSSWTGSCGTPGLTGANLAPGETTTCTIDPGADSLNVGANFADIAPCASRNRAQTDATTCGGCLSNHETTDPGDANDGTVTCNPSAPTTRAVAVSLSADGAVSANWAGLATAVAEGESENAPVAATVTFTATPEAGYYVSDWTGACATDATPVPLSRTTGENDAAAAAQTCVVDAGTGDIEAGAVFAEATDCATDNRVQDSATSCGACTTGRWWDGTSCTDERFDSTRATFRGHCTATEAGGSFSGYFRQDVRGGVVDVAEVCYGGITGGTCYLTTHPDFNPSARLTDDAGDPYNNVAAAGVANCAVNFPACESYEAQVTDGNPFSGCTTTTASCQSVDANSDTDNSGGCTCTIGGTFTAGQSDGCTAPATRAVSISDNQANGAVSATWAGLATAVAEGESGNAPTDAAVTITADPDATHYVAEWTGACADAADPTSNPTGSASAADETQTCVVAAGTGAVEAGALFAEAANDECAPTNPCGANSVCADPTPTATSTGDYECGCADGFSGPDTVGTATTCEDVDECATDADNCGEEEKCVNLPGSFECAALPKVEITTPAGRLFEAAPAAGTDCVIWKWTGSCKDVDATDDECTPTGEGMVTVGVVFDCGN